MFLRRLRYAVYDLHGSIDDVLSFIRAERVKFGRRDWCVEIPFQMLDMD